METVDRDMLALLGFDTAANRLKEKEDQARKLAVAYEHYQYVSEEAVKAFTEDMKARTLDEQRNNSSYTITRKWKEPKFWAVKDYPNVPPQDVLVEVEKAISRGCFDGFEVMGIEEVTEVTRLPMPEPVVFGRVKGCTDRFYVAQWDDDVKFEDIVKFQKER